MARRRPPDSQREIEGCTRLQLVILAALYNHTIAVDIRDMPGSNLARSVANSVETHSELRYWLEADPTFRPHTETFARVNGSMSGLVRRGIISKPSIGFVRINPFYQEAVVNRMDEWLSRILVQE